MTHSLIELLAGWGDTRARWFSDCPNIDLAAGRSFFDGTAEVLVEIISQDELHFIHIASAGECTSVRFPTLEQAIDAANALAAGRWV